VAIKNCWDFVDIMQQKIRENVTKMALKSFLISLSVIKIMIKIETTFFCCIALKSTIFRARFKEQLMALRQNSKDPQKIGKTSDKVPNKRVCFKHFNY
jgi:hypothetical protein